MACNCGKNKRKPIQPTGMKSSDEQKASGKKQTFELKLPSGKVEQFGSKLEARAQQARNGGMLRF